MRLIVTLICLYLTACAPWLVTQPEQAAESRVAVCKKTGSRITRPCDSNGSITEEQWDDVRSSVVKPPPTISERRGRKR